MHKDVNLTAITEHRDTAGCEHAIVIGPDFPAESDSKLLLAIEKDFTATGKTVTLMRAIDFARLVRIVPLKRASLERLRDLFKQCRTPEETRAFVETLAIEKLPAPPYREILESIEQIQKEGSNKSTVEYGTVIWVLGKRTPKVLLEKPELIEFCKALERMSNGLVFAHETTVEINQKVDFILKTIQATVQEYPEEEQKSAPLT